jgi:hypothetical protein
MKKNLSISAFAAIVMMVVMQWQGHPLKTPTTKLGIVHLEFADTATRLHELLAHWDNSVVKVNIWLDFFFIVSYVSFFAIACVYAAMKWADGSTLRAAGMVLARLAFAAGVFDIAENLLMLQSIGGNYTDASLILTWYCAAIKFLVIAVIILYLLLSLPKLLGKKAD